MKLTDIFNFGKHKGEQLEDVIYDDPQYVVWLYEQDCEFAEDTIDLLKKRKLI